MLEAGPGLLGLCPVRGITEINQETKGWLVNSGLRPIEVAEGQVVALAERVAEVGIPEHGDDKLDTNEVNGMVPQAAPHTTVEEQEQLVSNQLI